MNLRPGITGIQGLKDPSPVPPLSDLKTFRAHCHLVARTVGARLQGIEDPFKETKVCNYVAARFEFSDSFVVAMLNVIYPIIAFAKCPSEGQIVFEYVDCPRLAEAFQEVGEYTVATSKELSLPLLGDMCKDLTLSEQKCVRYFRPARVGNVIFNYWD